MVDEVGQPKVDHARFEIGHAVLERGAIGQYPRVKLRSDGRVAAVGVDAEGDRRGTPGSRSRPARSARKARSQDGAVRQIAEAFAEIERRRVRGEPISADACRAAATPFDAEPADITNSCSGRVRNCYLNVVSRFSNPLAPGPGASGLRMLSRSGQWTRRRVGDPLGKFPRDTVARGRRIVGGLEAGTVGRDSSSLRTDRR